MKKIWEISIGLILLFSAVNLLLDCIKWNAELKNYCSDNCNNHNNENKDCGTRYHIDGCHDEDAPNETIFGMNITNKENWCYELQGGKCGEFGIYYFSFFMIGLYVFFVGGFIYVIIANLFKKGEVK